MNFEMDFTVYSLITIFALAVNLLFLRFVLTKVKENIILRYYLVVVIIVIGWQIIELINQMVDLGDFTTILQKISFSITMFLGLYYFLFILSFLKKELNKIIIFIFHLVGLSIVIFGFLTDKIIKGGTENLSWGRYYDAGEYHFLFSFFVAGFFILSIFYLISAYIKTKDKEHRKVILFILIGSFLATIGGSVTDLFLPLFKIDFISLGGLFSTVMAATIVIAMYKFKFLDIRPKRFTIGKKLLLSLLLVLFFSISIIGYISFDHSRRSIEERVRSHLDSVANDNAYWISSFVKEKKRNIAILSSSPAVIQTFELRNIQIDNFAEEKIKEQAKQVAREIDQYIVSKPDLTIGDLQNDQEFQKIAVQTVGKTGYTAVTDYDGLVCRFHKNEAIVDLELKSLADKLPGFWGIMAGTRGGQEAGGYYDWEEADGSIKKKYMYISLVNAKTADNIGLHVAATTYVDEYKSAFDLYVEAEKYLKRVAASYEYQNIYLIDRDGEIWWEAQENDMLGMNLNLDLPKHYQLKYVFNQAKEHGKPAISDYEFNKNNAVLYLAAQIQHEKLGLLGYLAIEISNAAINDLITKTSCLGETVEIYVVGNDYLMRSNARFISDSTILTQEVKTINSIECFDHKDTQQSCVAEVFNNYRGVSVLGTHVYIPDNNWCLLAEIDKKEAFASIAKIKITILNISFFLACLVFLWGILLTRTFTKPINKLVRTAHEFSRGNFNYKAGIKTKDEFRILDKAFIQAGEKLTKARAKEEKYQETLKKEVDEKTRELKKMLIGAEADKKELEKRRTATLNILKDVSESKQELNKLNFQLKKKSGQLSTLKALSDEVSGATEIEGIIEVLNRYICDQLDLTTINYIIVDPADEGGVIYTSFLKKEVSDKYIQLCEDSLVDFIKKQKNIKSNSIIPVIKSIQPKLLGEKLNNSVKDIPSAIKELPLAVGDNNFGVIQITNSDGKKIRKDEIKMIEAIVFTAALNIDKLQTLIVAQHSKTASLVEILSNGVVLIDNNREVSLLNPAFEKLTGLDIDTFSLAEFDSKMKTADLNAVVNESFSKGKAVSINEVEYNESFFDVYVAPVKDNINNITGTAIIIHDITYLKAIDKMKTEFVSVASHQLRTPLTAIKLFTDMLRREDVGGLNKNQAEYVANIYESTNRMVRLVNDLLNVTRIESGKLAINPVYLDLDKFLINIISETKPLADEKKQKIVYLKSRDKLPKILLDQNLIRQVIHNLIVNAIRYSPEKKGVITVSVTKSNDNFIISINDNGMGIPKDFQKRIFEKFYRADNAIKAITEGTGLGLFVSKMIVESSGGKIWFESKEGRGTSFFVQMSIKGMKEKKGDKGLSVS